MNIPIPQLSLEPTLSCLQAWNFGIELRKEESTPRESWLDRLITFKSISQLPFRFE